jgi:hypothetical protein
MALEELSQHYKDEITRMKIAIASVLSGGGE